MAPEEMTSCPGLFGTTSHYDKSGRRVGRSEPAWFGEKKTKWDK